MITTNATEQNITALAAMLAEDDVISRAICLKACNKALCSPFMTPFRDSAPVDEHAADLFTRWSRPDGIPVNVYAATIDRWLAGYGLTPFAVAAMAEGEDAAAAYCEFIAMNAGLDCRKGFAA